MFDFDAEHLHVGQLIVMNSTSASTVFASLSILASLAIACGSTVDAANNGDGDPSANGEGEPSTTDSDIKLGKKKKATCASVGGQCVGLNPSSCSSGKWADANKVSCGNGVGIGAACCLQQCPTLSPPAPGFCTGGTLKPKVDANGCTTGYDCIQPAKTACELGGGKCVGLAPSSCPSGNWADYSTHSCGTGIGAGCCLP